MRGDRRDALEKRVSRVRLAISLVFLCHQFGTGTVELAVETDVIAMEEV
jgi:hypothetical protein